MYIEYNNQKLKCHNCISFKDRLIGNMFQKNINKALLFDKCNSIHTFFMKEEIDVIMCNKENVILYFYQNLSPRKVIMPKKSVTKVIETPANFFDIKINTKIDIS